MEDGLLASHPPFTPPTTEGDRLSWLRLIRSRRVGPATFHRLIAEHGTAEAALDALPDIARAAGVTGYSACPEAEARAELAAGRKAGARLVCYGAPDYPADLMDLPDAPPVLWVIGDTRLLLRPMVAVVGARNASSLGLRMARRMAEGLAAEGIAVVSGLARGIDAAAHEGALAGGTVAVHAGGVDVVYPAENADLAARIAARGARVAELPPGAEPQARHFPQRNRIVSGIALGVVVIEAAEGSGSLITARTAADQGREIMAIPGHPVDARAAGCNALIRDGATLVRNPADVIEALGPALAAARAARAAMAPPTEPEAATPAPAARLGRLTEAALAAIRGRMTATDAAARPPPPPGQAPARRTTEASATGRASGQAGRAAHGNGRALPQDAGPDPTDGSAAVGRAASDARTQARPTAAGQHSGPAAPGRPGGLAHAPLHTRILERLGPSPLAEDQLIRDLGVTPAEAAAELLTLELDGVIERQPGGLLARIA
jgi:DNA processing protein